MPYFAGYERFCIDCDIIETMESDEGEDPCEIVEVTAASSRFDEVVQLAATVLNQDRHLLQPARDAHQSHVLAAFADGQCVGFLRFLIQDIGQDADRPPVVHEGAPLREGYVEAFGVEPEFRRRGVGTSLQALAAERCSRSGCYQMRSRSPVTSTENYALKIDAGYTLHPSNENDSYYFMQRL